MAHQEAAAAAHYAAAYAGYHHHNYESQMQMQMMDPTNASLLVGNSGLVGASSTGAGGLHGGLHGGLVDLGQSNCIQDIHAAS